MAPGVSDSSPPRVASPCRRLIIIVVTIIMTITARRARRRNVGWLFFVLAVSVASLLPRTYAKKGRRVFRRPHSAKEVLEVMKTPTLPRWPQLKTNDAKRNLLSAPVVVAAPAKQHPKLRKKAAKAAKMKEKLKVTDERHRCERSCGGPR